MCYRAVAAAIAVLLALSACSAPVGAGASGRTTAPPSVHPGPIESGGALPSLMEGEEFIVYPPDSVWGLMATGGASGADDLAQAIDMADAVIVGRVATIDRGDAYGPSPSELGWYAVATIEVDSVLAGRDPGNTVTVPFMLVMGGDRYPEKELYDLRQSLPREPALLFLRSWTSYFDLSTTEPPGWLEGLDRDDLYRLIGRDGAVRIVDGRLAPPRDEIHWNRSLDGLLLQDAVQGIEDTAQH